MIICSEVRSDLRLLEPVLLLANREEAGVSTYTGSVSDLESSVLVPWDGVGVSTYTGVILELGFLLLQASWGGEGGSMLTGDVLDLLKDILVLIKPMLVSPKSLSGPRFRLEGCWPVSHCRSG